MRLTVDATGVCNVAVLNDQRCPVTWFASILGEARKEEREGKEINKQEML